MDLREFNFLSLYHMALLCSAPTSYLFLEKTSMLDRALSIKSTHNEKAEISPKRESILMESLTTPSVNQLLLPQHNFGSVVSKRW